MRFGNPIRGLIGPPGKPDPDSGFVVTQGFGDTATAYGPHDGLDIGNGRSNDDVLAMADGEVYQAFYDAASGGAGIVRIDHGDGWTTGYAHLTGIAVAVGTRVGEGQNIAALDTTGWASGAHLHYDVSRHGERLDPWPYANAPADTAEGEFWMHTYGGAEFDHTTQRYETLEGARFRADTTTDAAILETFGAGQSMTPHAVVSGQNVNGSDQWYLAWAYVDGRYRMGAFHVSTLRPA
jgi:murein DD-endopeptidase MepM/ murein hydrolase activator NlpD